MVSVPIFTVAKLYGSILTPPPKATVVCMYMSRSKKMSP